MWALPILAVLVACGDGPGKQTIRDKTTLETFEERMCKCTDPACAQQIIADFARWSKVIKKPRQDPDRAAKIMDRYNACLTAAIRRQSSP